MDDKSLEASGTMCFHGVEYAVSIWVQQDELHVQVEEESFKATSEINRWGAQFPALCAYHSTLIRHFIKASECNNESCPDILSCIFIDIEELTKKTGNFKRFYMFVNMLISALNHKSESVFIDLLTYSDLVQ
jgi:hypothetical protein